VTEAQPAHENMASSGRSEQSVAAPKTSKLKEAGGRARVDVQDDIFSKPTVLQIEIEIPRTGMALLRRTSWGGGNGEPRPTASATIREDGIVYTNVAVHLKGAAGSFRPVEDRPAMTLKFDKSAPDQSFHGMHKISLNNSVQDPSLLSEKICRELFDAAGVPVPRAGHALVKLNGRNLGLYVLLEGANKQFLKRYFKNASGNLYDGGFVRDVSESMAVNCGDHPDDHSDLRTLIAAVQETAQNRNLASLEKALDLDRFLSMLSVEVMAWHWDGYGLNKNNWRIFHDAGADRMVFIPHGLDQTFGIANRGPVEFTKERWSGAVAQVVMRTPEGRRRYRERFGQIYTNVFQLDKVLGRIDEIEAAIVPALAKVDPQEARNQEQQAAWFKQLVARRHEALSHQLGTPVEPSKFGPNGVLQLTGWRQAPARNGGASLSERKDQGQALLVVSAHGNVINNGFWRRQVVLAPGRYRFIGRVRVVDVNVQTGDQRAGAGLRISRGPMQGRLSGTTDWADITYEFQVEEEATEIELICELTRAIKGEAQFDERSLRLIRLP
jgi:spore coat protein CotH